jgi:hypothetical protein
MTLLKGQRLFRLMCGRPLAFGKCALWNLGYAQLLLGRGSEFHYVDGVTPAILAIS